jgi:acetyltransferase-like isoleucine patch superfamily enzyme
MWHYLIRLAISQTYWKLRLGKLGFRSVLFKPMLVAGAAHISIGKRSQIRDFARLEVIHRPHLGWNAHLHVGNNVNIEQGVHIVCQGTVTIEDGVSITPYCAIVDTYHPFDSPDQPPKIGVRLPDVPTYVVIGEGSFIGTKTVILPNVRIGKGCVVGAGSVVTHDLPDYSVASGSPAKVVRTFNPVTREWQRAVPTPLLAKERLGQPV